MAFLLSILSFLLAVMPAKRSTADPKAFSQFTPDIVAPTPDDEWWKRPNVFTMWGEPSEISGLTTVIGWGGEEEQFVRRMHSKNGYFVGSLGFWNLDYSEYQEHPEYAESRVIDIFGQPMVENVGSTIGEPIYRQNTNHPLWQAYLLKKAQHIVDIGADGLLIDEIQGTYETIWNGGSFGEPDMSLFRTYLAENHTPQELLDLFGIDDIGTFDYRDYIHDLGLADVWINDSTQVPLYADYEDFQLTAIKSFVNELVSQTNDYSMATRGQELVFTANLGDSLTFRIFSESRVFLNGEHTY
jgi:hypothetical protein